MIWLVYINQESSYQSNPKKSYSLRDSVLFPLFTHCEIHSTYTLTLYPFKF